MLNLSKHIVSLIWLINSRDVRASLGELRQASLRFVPIDFCRLQCAAVVTVTGLLACLFLMLFFHDLHSLPVQRLPSVTAP